MCLAQPGKIVKIDKKKKRAIIDFEGLKKEIDISLVKRVKPGDFVNIHAGFAIQKLTQRDAKAILREYGKIS